MDDREIAIAQYGGNPVNVSAYACIVGRGGQRTVPVGSTIVIRSGWASTVPGGVKAFLQAQTTILSVNDGPVVDVSDRYGRPGPGTLGPTTIVEYPTGVTLPTGRASTRFTFASLLERPVTDTSDYDGEGTIDPTRAEPGLQWGGTCTVRAG